MDTLQSERLTDEELDDQERFHAADEWETTRCAEEGWPLPCPTLRLIAEVREWRGHDCSLRMLAGAMLAVHLEGDFGEPVWGVEPHTGSQDARSDTEGE